MPTTGKSDRPWPHCAYRVAEREDKPVDLAAVLTTRDVAARLGITSRRVLALAHARGVGHRVGRALLSRPYQVEALCAGRGGLPRRQSE